MIALLDAQLTRSSGLNDLCDVLPIFYDFGLAFRVGTSPTRDHLSTAMPPWLHYRLLLMELDTPAP